MAHAAFTVTKSGNRPTQQDRARTFVEGDRLFCVVADGAGGTAGGAAAAEAVIEAAERMWESRGVDSREEPAPFLGRFAEQAQAAVRGIAKGSGGGRSTVAALLVSDSVAAWMHCGDSRIYRFDRGSFASRTHDHSVVELLHARKKVSEREMGTHPDQNKLYSSLGGEESPEVAIDSCPAGTETSFILCSDGFWSHVLRDEMEAIFSAQDASALCEELVRVAIARADGDADNVSVIVAKIHVPLK